MSVVAVGKRAKTQGEDSAVRPKGASELLFLRSHDIVKGIETGGALYMITIVTEEEWQMQVNQLQKPFLLFKHSTTCPISAGAYREITRYDAKGEIPILMVKVIESRPLSLKLADVLGVSHASPQVVLIDDGVAVWMTSHGQITEQNLMKAVAAHRH